MQKILYIVLIILVFTGPVQADMGPYDWASVHLNELRDEKVVQLRGFCNRVHQQAQNAAKQQQLIDFFDLNLRYYQAASQSTPPEELTETINTLHEAFQEHYIRNWLAFYDILFISMDGDIFYSIRKEADYKTNIIKNNQFNTELSKCIAARPDKEHFIDFHFYGASKEAASFIVEPIFNDNKQIGWIALQLAVNKINSLFASTESLGATCETFVVNRQGYMLTESNFVSDETILKTRLDEGNIEPKFQDGRGNRMVTDYRGCKVLTAFEVFDFMGVKWLVVAKIDEAQITTEHYQQHREYYNEEIIKSLNSKPVIFSQTQDIPLTNKEIRRVDMDEYVRAKHNEILQTMGVSTCTAVVAMYPAKFAYLAHISTLDSVYGGSGTDLISSITKKIKTYDIYKYQRRYVQFVIIARHLNSLESIIDKLVSEGILLSQISVLYNPQANYARVIYDYSSNGLNVIWVTDKGNENNCVQNAESSQNIGMIIKDCIDTRQVQYSNAKLNNKAI